MKASNQQIRIISTLLRKHNLDGQKAHLVLGATNGRSESRADLKYNEAESLIGYLNTQGEKADRANQMRRKLIAKAHNMGWETSPGKADMKRLDAWCMNNGYLKKPLNDYTLDELPKLVSQFDIVYKKELLKVVR